MRIFCFIFIGYLLLLSWQPCQDLAAKAASGAFAEARQIHTHDDSPPEETDDCSPFCICSCCQTSTAVGRLRFSFSSRFTVSTEKTAVSLYQNHYFQQYSSSIWQPPKFSFTA